MKVIFLDFDGVINNWDCFNGVSIDNIMILKKILSKTDAKIVATTSKKYSLQRENSPVDYYSSVYYNEYVKILNKLGIEIFDITPYVDADRTLEIEKYLEQHQVEQYVIVDDELIGERLQEHQVILDLYMGLQEEHIEPILRILNGQLGFYPENYNRNETPNEWSIRINEYHLSKEKTR